MRLGFLSRLVRALGHPPDAMAGPPSLKRYRALVLVDLFSPEQMVGPDGSPAGEAVGYVQNLGVTADSG